MLKFDTQFMYRNFKEERKFKTTEGLTQIKLTMSKANEERFIRV